MENIENKGYNKKLKEIERILCLKGIAVERKIFYLHERTIDKSPGFAKGTEICKRWEVNMEVGQA